MINSISKILESVTLVRMLQTVEKTWGGEQFAYRAARGTELHLAEVYTTITGFLADNQFVFLANLDISGAFDAVSHDYLLRSLRDAGVDLFLLRYVSVWLRERKFRLKLMSHRGRFLSKSRHISCGLPQGGVLSPFLWNTFSTD